MKILSFDVGIKNLAYCMLDDEGHILYWELLSVETPRRTNTSTDISLCIIKKLDERPFLLTCDTVLIEKQPKFNPKMKVVQETLKTYFLIRGVVDCAQKMNILAYSPRRKLSCSPYDGPPLQFKVKSAYSQRKKTSVAQCSWMIKNDTRWKEYYESIKKKDDLSDAYLQGMSFLHNKTLPTTKDKVLPRKPTSRQEKYNKYSKSNLKYFFNCFVAEQKKPSLGLSHYFSPKGVPSSKSENEILKEWISASKNLHKSLIREYGGLTEEDTLNALAKDLESVKTFGSDR